MRLSRLKSHIHVFSLVSVLAGVLLIVPFIATFTEAFGGDLSAWNHIREHLLYDTIINTIILVGFVALFSSAIGFYSAYVVERYSFKGRTFFKWGLMLPLALPSYIAAYVYADMLSYTGTVTRFLNGFGVNHGLNVMTLPGAIFIFTFTLFPYAYMLTRASIARQDASVLESATLLNAGPLRTLFKITLPLARPALVAGTFLVVLETLNDYGVVSYFNVRVFSFAIFDAWFRLGDTLAAIRLSYYLLGLVFILIMIERLLRGRRAYTSTSYRPIRRTTLSSHAKRWVPLSLSLIMALGFFIPVLQLLYYAWLTIAGGLSVEILYISLNAISIALVTTVITVAIALMIVNFNRGKASLFKRAILRLTTLGYAIPGAVIAIAVMLFFIDIDRFSAPYREGPTLFLTASLLMLGFAYVLRFMAIAFGSLESAYAKTGEKYTEVSYTLGRSRLYTLLFVDVPLIKGGLISAAIIVFIDIFKELPLTLILRPTNYDTLATMAHRYAREEMIQEASMPSLIMIAIASVLVYLLTHRVKKGRVENAR
jgi:iron(III) transport system permease protein